MLNAAVQNQEVMTHLSYMLFNLRDTIFAVKHKIKRVNQSH